jgi:hypothetical protein
MGPESRASKALRRVIMLHPPSIRNGELAHARGWIGNHLLKTRLGLFVNSAIFTRMEIKDLLVFRLDILEFSVVDSK